MYIWKCSMCSEPCEVKSEEKPTECVENRADSSWVNIGKCYDETDDDNIQLINSPMWAMKFWYEIIQNDEYDYKLYVRRLNSETGRMETVRVTSTPAFEYPLDDYVVVCSSHILKLTEMYV